jgi:hypothetical protein
MVGMRSVPATASETIISADDYADEIEVPSFALRMKCSKCGGKRVDVRPNWKEAPGMPDITTAAGPVKPA